MNKRTRKVFFSFHSEDLWRVDVVRNALYAEPAARFQDASLWEEAKKKGDMAIRRLIDRELAGTSVTVVLIGAHTASREYVNYEIEKSIERGNGLLGVYVHDINDQQQKTFTQGAAPSALIDAGARLYTWDRDKCADWIEQAYQEAEHARRRSPERDHGFEASFQPDLSEYQIKGAFQALADYYRACGGIGLSVDFEIEEAEVKERINA